MKKHQTIKGPQVCKECNGVFINLRAHIKEVHERRREHVCTFCSKEFAKKSGLVRHIQTVHEKLRNWFCDLCEKAFGEKGQMQRHQKTHFKPLTTEAECKLDDLIDEEEIVEDKVRFICGICKKKVNSKAALRRHKATVHGKKRPWLCDLCPKSFGEKYNLLRHIKSHVDEHFIIEKLDEAEEETFECKSCQKVLTTQWGLKLHEEKCTLTKQIHLNQVFIDPANCHEVKEEVELNIIDEATFVSIEEEQNVECEIEESTAR